MLTEGLPEKITPVGDGRHDGLFRRQPTPRAAKKALIRGRMVSSQTCLALAVTRKSSAHRMSWMWWRRRCHVPPCTTASSPSNTLVLTTGELIPPWGTPAVGGTGLRGRENRCGAMAIPRVCASGCVLLSMQRPWYRKSPGYLPPRSRWRRSAGDRRCSMGRSPPRTGVGAETQRSGDRPWCRPWAARLADTAPAALGRPAPGSTRADVCHFSWGYLSVAGAPGDSVAIARGARRRGLASLGYPSAPHPLRGFSSRCAR
jgi:hypothetical protein